MKMPPQGPIKGPRTEEDRALLAAKAEYVGSSEHKGQRWWGGLPTSGSRPKRQKTSICPLVSVAEKATATLWIKEAIKLGQYTYLEGDKDFPKHVWYEANGTRWFGYCTNSVAGEYKGWPLEEEE